MPTRFLVGVFLCVNLWLKKISPEKLRAYFFIERESYYFAAANKAFTFSQFTKFQNAAI